MASALSALAGTLRGKFSNRQGHSKGAVPLTSKRGPRDFYKGKGAKSTGTLTKKGACVHVCMRAPAPRGTCQTVLRSPMHQQGSALCNLAYGHFQRVWALTREAPGRAVSFELRVQRMCRSKGTGYRSSAKPGVLVCAFIFATPRCAAVRGGCAHIATLAAGIFVVQPHKLEEFVVPDLEGCEVRQANMGSLLSLSVPSPVLECSSHTGRLDAVETVRGLQHTETQAS
jgi:hypothetical protein